MKKFPINHLNNPLVSVCIASYNHEKYIADAVESIIAQTYQNWELIVVDDASSDASPQILKDYQKRYPEKIKVTLLDKNRGQAYAFSRACFLGQGKYIAALGSDDRAHKTRLSKQVQYLERHSKVGAVVSKVFYIDANGMVFKPEGDLFNNTEITNLRRQLLQRNFLSAPSSMLRMDIIKELKGYNSGLSCVEDYDFWLRLLDNHEIVRLDDKLTYYRIHGRNLSFSGAFGSHYESVICILRAIKRWPIDKIFGLKGKAKEELYASDKSIALAYAELGAHCLNTDQVFFGRPMLATSTAYEFALKALTHDSDCVKAQAVLNKVYEILGDNPRANGKKSISFFEWQEQKDADRLSIAGDSHGNDSAQGGEKSLKQSGVTDEITDGETLYQNWISRNTFQDSHFEIFNERFTNWSFQPLFHVILPLRAGEENLLADTIDSLSQQLYQNWRLSVIADFTCPNPVFDELEILEWVQIKDSSKVYQVANNLLDLVQASWVFWITPGATFQPQFFNICGDYINANPEWRLIYSDEDVITPEGERQNPQFKPDLNLDLLRSTPYIGNNVLVQRDTLREVGGYIDIDTALVNYDITLKVFDLYSDSAIGHIAELIFHQSSLNLRNTETLETQGSEVLKNHLARNGINANVSAGLLPGSFFVDYPLSSRPLVSIIIPTRDSLDLLKPCMQSLLAKTSYTNYEIIIVDNNSIQSETSEYLESLQTNDERVRVIRYPDEFNFSAINNQAARQARGDYLVLLNNDTIIVQDNWLERMIALGVRPEVGVVGCRLVYPDQRVQHAGVILGLGGVVEFVNQGLPIHEPGYMGRAQVVQNYSAVTAACLLVKKSLYFEAGGLDEERFPVLFNDVDFCLKVGVLGRKIVWTPYVTVVHHGGSSLKNVQDSKTISRYHKRADAALLEKWLPKLANDPAYNRHLSLSHQDCRIELEASASWDTNFRDRFRVLAAPFNSFGTGEYRVRAPLRALENASLAQCALLPGNDEAMRLPEVVELERLQPDTLLVQNADHDLYLMALERYKKFANHVFRVFGQDDLVFQVPKKNPYRQVAPRDLKWRIRKALSLCDRLIVATAPMAEALRGMIDDICIVPNYLEDSLWQDLVSQRRAGRKPRVGWAGGEQHQGDLELILPLVKATAQEFDWVFFGMCPEGLRPYVKEIHNGVPFMEYPAKLASLNLDVAVAPLEHNRFNVAKSNLRLLEYGIMGWPTICSDIEPYRDAPVVRVPNNPNAWIKAVREYAYDLDAAAVEGDKLKQWVLDNWMLSNHAEDWLAALMPH